MCEPSRRLREMCEGSCNGRLEKEARRELRVSAAGPRGLEGSERPRDGARVDGCRQAARRQTRRRLRRRLGQLLSLSNGQAQVLCKEERFSLAAGPRGAWAQACSRPSVRVTPYE